MSFLWGVNIRLHLNSAPEVEGPPDRGHSKILGGSTQCQGASLWKGRIPAVAWFTDSASLEAP